MKLVVMSDSHGDMEAVKSIAGLSADASFHCGDSEGSFSDPAFGSMHKVRGNCDTDPAFPKSVIVSVGGKKIFAVHGHKHNVKQSLLELYYSAKEQQADIVLFGHSHLYGAEMKDGILFVNPGSTLMPRGGKAPTYAVIEWDDSVRVIFKNMDNEVVEAVEIKNR